jgi:hypothetical protein
MYKMLFLANQKKPISKSCRAGPIQDANLLGIKILKNNKNNKNIKSVEYILRI